MLHQECTGRHRLLQWLHAALARGQRRCTGRPPAASQFATEQAEATGLTALLGLGAGTLLTCTVVLMAVASLAPGLWPRLGVAVASLVLTWMIFWMRKNARSLGSELRAKLDLATSAKAVIVLAFVAVVREGLETVLLLLSAKAEGSHASGTAVVVGGLIGLAIAAVLGWLTYLGGARINMRIFFNVTGVLLILVAAGVLTYGLHELAEAGRIPETAVAFDISSWYAEQSWYGSLLKGIFGFRAQMLWLEVVAWFAYVVPVTWVFLRGIGRRDPAPRPAVPANA